MLSAVSNCQSTGSVEDRTTTHTKRNNTKAERCAEMGRRIAFVHQHHEYVQLQHITAVKYNKSNNIYSLNPKGDA
eukprot:4576146-Amphidinium_carterae.1